MSRDDAPRENGRDGPEQEHKAFVGGISWHMNDRELKDSRSRRPQRENPPLGCSLSSTSYLWCLQLSERKAIWQKVRQLCWTK